MKLSVEKKTTYGFLIALVFLVATGVFSLLSINSFINAFASIDHTHEVLRQLETSQLGLLKAETLGRGYMLLRDEQLLKPYESAGLEARAGLVKLRRLTSDNPVQQKNMDELDRFVADKFTYMDESNRLRREGKQAELLQLVGPKTGQAIMDKITRVIQKMRAEEEGLLIQRSSRAQILGQLVSQVVMAVMAVALALGATAITILRRDSAKRAQAEEELRKTSAEIRDLYNKAPCGYHSLNVDTVFVSINDTELSWLGYDREEIIGKKKFSEILAPESRSLFGDLFPQFKETGVIRDIELTLLRKDGSRFSVLASSDVVRDAKGDFLWSRTTCFDVTQLKLANEEIEKRNREREEAAGKIHQLNEDLKRRAALLETANQELEAFSYSVSHDLRAPLRHVDGFAGLLGKHSAAQLDGQGLRYLKVITDSTKRMGQLIDDLLVFSRVGRTAMTMADVSVDQVVRDAVLDLQLETAGRDIQWSIGPLPVVRVDPALFRQVFSNLIGNAVKYTRLKSPARIEVGHWNSRDRASAGNGVPETGAAEHVFFVRDNGAGFDMQYAGKLFGVFQRLHASAEFEGTGIGLANVQRIIQRHGGRTWAEGKVGEGATFYFSLPSIT